MAFGMAELMEAFSGILSKFSLAESRGLPFKLFLSFNF